MLVMIICQLYMWYFEDGDIIYVELFWASVFLVIKDLCIDCFVFDCIIQAGGFIFICIGDVFEANVILIGY